eukprot:SAG22_NODE_7289_length_754_cov_3.061069_2_plen_98_part_00
MPTLFVGNLPYSTTDEDIAFAFSSYGCSEAKVGTDIETVSMAMHDTEFQGRRLIVREDRTKESARARQATKRLGPRPKCPRQTTEHGSRLRQAGGKP